MSDALIQALPLASVLIGYAVGSGLILLWLERRRKRRVITDKREEAERARRVTAVLDAHGRMK